MSRIQAMIDGTSKTNVSKVVGSLKPLQKQGYHFAARFRNAEEEQYIRRWAAQRIVLHRRQTQSDPPKDGDGEEQQQDEAPGHFLDVLLSRSPPEGSANRSHLHILRNPLIFIK